MKLLRAHGIISISRKCAGEYNYGIPVLLIKEILSPFYFIVIDYLHVLLMKEIACPFWVL
jgi:hypothetical protein